MMVHYFLKIRIFFFFVFTSDYIMGSAILVLYRHKTLHPPSSFLTTAIFVSFSILSMSMVYFQYSTPSFSFYINFHSHFHWVTSRRSPNLIISTSSPSFWLQLGPILTITRYWINLLFYPPCSLFTYPLKHSHIMLS